MKIDRFKELLTDSLKNSGHAGIETLDTYHEPDQANPIVKCTDGTEIYLTVVRTSRPGGDKPDADVVERPEGVDVEIVQRA